MFPLFKKKPIIDKVAQQKVEACIHEAESKTSGEIRVYMEHKCAHADPMTRAREVFAQLEMHKTDARNAILVYVAFADRKFALLGDKVIYEKAGGPAFWEKAAAQLTGHLKKNEITEGLCNCITQLGVVLAAEFPADPSTKKNELPDDIVFGK